jgi:Xaa-Pro dipeptidase
MTNTTLDTSALTTTYAEHIARLRADYDRALTHAKLDAVVIHSGSLKRRTEFDDQDWPLRPTPHFMHWLPWPEPECALVVSVGRAPRLLRLEQSTYWEAPVREESSHFWASFETEVVSSHEAMRAQMPKGHVAFVGENTARGESWGFSRDVCNVQPLLAALDALRTTKTAYEVLCLAEANRRAALGHDVLRGAFEAGVASELELHLLYLRATAQDDPETPYKNIVALGEHAATLHHVGYQKTKSGAASLLVDAGATCMGYASDITRTWVKSTGEAARVFRGLIDRMESMQKGLVSAIESGAPYEALHERSHREVSAILHDCGLVRLAVDAIDQQGISRAFYPHGLGHSLGLQCHDVGCAVTKPKPNNPFLRNTSTIAAGQVFTIEPGLYFISGLLEPLRAGPHGGDIDWKLVEELRAFGGIRIEDDVVVEANGTRNLTREVLPLGGGAV